MKIIFLDIDGVLNSVQHSVSLRKQGSAYDAAGINKTSLGLLKWVCEVTKAEIIISSSWRRQGEDWIKGVFAAHNWWYPPIIGITPILKGHRGEEIQDVLNNNPDIEKYVIIDDDSDMLDEQKSFFVHTDALVGFTIYDALKCIDILGVLPEYEKIVDELNEHSKFRLKKPIKKVIIEH